MNTDRLAAGKEQTARQAKQRTRWRERMVRPADSYGLVLVLVVLAYIVISINSTNKWWIVCSVMLQGLALVFALLTSRARRLWVLLAGIFVVVATAATIVQALIPGPQLYSEQIQAIGGLLLLVTPVAIVRRIITHTVVTTETVLGAICVYVLIGFSFASLYQALALFGQTPFFSGVSHATRNDYLFFSYTTLTTVGYGNLVPAETMGQTFAMLEALLGQIYLVIIVARLVALWGLALPRASAHHTASEPPPTSPITRHPPQDDRDGLE
jgi:hypothetical protein